MTSVPPTQPPAAPETDVSALVEALAKHLHERFSPDWAPHWDDLDETEQADSIHADMARSLLEPDGALTALLADLSAARERVRVVEGERDALRIDLATCERIANGIEDRAESAEAAHRALQAAVEALADEYAEYGAQREAAGRPAWPNNVARDLRALLAGGGAR